MDIRHTLLSKLNPRLVEASVLREALRVCLQDNDCFELFDHVKSVKRTGNRITIATGKPIVNDQLKLIQRSLIERLQSQSFSGIEGSESLVIQFR